MSDVMSLGCFYKDDWQINKWKNLAGFLVLWQINKWKNLAGFLVLYNHMKNRQ